MTKSPTRELPPQTNEEPPPRRRNVYDYDGEYEFCTVQHWSPECPTEQLRLAIFSGFGFAVAQAHSLGVMRLPGFVSRCRHAYVAEVQFRYNKREKADTFGAAISRCWERNPVVDEQEHESNEREPPPRKPLVSRILCAFKCQYHRFTRPSKNGETENQKK
jgi:hypothetical protein